MNILGINAYHADSAACLVCDGKLVAAAEEERFRRVKHWAGFPSRAVNYCLKEADFKLSDINHVAVNTDPYANLYKKAYYAIFKRPNLTLVIDRLKNQKKRLRIMDKLQEAVPNSNLNASLHHVEHHMAHMASAHMVSPFEDSVAVSIDGFGDFSSAAWGPCFGTDMSVDGRVYYPHSMGIFYQAMTQFLGFPNYGDEYKVMGLAPYGKPRYLDEMRQVVNSSTDGLFELNLDYFRHHRNKVEYKWSGGTPETGDLFNEQKMSNLFKLDRRKSKEPLNDNHYDLAHSIQAMYEEIFFNILSYCHSKFGINNLTLAGGCAMNSVANGKVYRRSKFQKVYIQSAAGDAGGAIGAAYTIAKKFQETKNRFHMNHAYWGPEMSNEYHEKMLNKRKSEIEKNQCLVEFIKDEKKLCDFTAQAISQGQVIGWFQGRMEWGPRALGNRSILCDPRNKNMKEILNNKIKRRESFRPFAPSIIRERVAKWFEEDDDVPFMMKVFQVREEKRNEIPAVTHCDGSGRLQTVCHQINPIYYMLISSFEKITGVPILLNTSFNENEPVVCLPDEAISTFLRTKMDVLVIGNWVVKRVNLMK
tara:strand:- start:1187 stop:2950 length:1764 start_codon:yes stop_codon:yes gene_type:complete